ncbi:MAG: GNAT family N-acetyltransferase [Vulcanimicrobiaceae bacterium]
MDSVSSSRRAMPAVVLKSYDRLLDIVENQSHVTLIAELEGVPVGFLLLLDRLSDEVTGEPQAFIAYMAVERAHRQGGIGAALMRAAEDEARSRALPYMALMVTEENAAARELYAKAGFVTERRLLCKEL